ncbi:MAG: hypothetical protein MUF83_03950 [Acidimicrobiales bacterium]|nr:hypothetical protein [Acidimicrobiales bacterium]
MDEEVVVSCDQLLKWDAPKRKQTVFKAKLGRLIVTNARVVFLSTGSNDLTMGKFVAGATGLHSVGLRSSSTDHLDASALGAEGSLEIPLPAVSDVWVKGMFKALTIAYDLGAGEQHATFAPKNGPIPGGESWVQVINDAKAQYLAAMGGQ